MAKVKLKVFHGLVNYGTQAGLLAQELRNQGIDSISVVHPDSSKRQVDVELFHGKYFIQRIYMYAWNTLRKLYWFFSYNTFHFYFGFTLFKNQRDLPFYKLFRKKVVMEYLGNDIRNYHFLVQRYNLPSEHEFSKRMIEHDTRVAKRINFEKQYIDYNLACLPKYMHFAKLYNYKINEILPLAVDLANIHFVVKETVPQHLPLNILHAPTKKWFKGTVFIEGAIKKLKDEGFMINFRVVDNISHAQLFEEYKTCDIFIDQISTGWYGTAALEAMAFGKPTCAFFDELYFDYIAYADEIPVINVNRENVTDKLRELIENREQLGEIGKKSREFIEKYHDVKNVTKRLIDIYKNKVWTNYPSNV